MGIDVLGIVRRDENFLSEIIGYRYFPALVLYD